MKNSPAYELTRRVLKTAFEIAASKAQRTDSAPEHYCWPLEWHHGEWVQMDRYSTRARRKLRQHAVKIAKKDPIMSDALTTFASYHDTATPGVANLGFAHHVLWEHHAARFAKHEAVKAAYSEAVKAGDLFTFDTWHKERFSQPRTSSPEGDGSQVTP